MDRLLGLSRGIDWISDQFGKLTWGLVFASVFISAGNAVVRKLFGYSSNAWLEIQWYLFAGVFLLGAAYTFRHNEHVRIDVLSSRLSKRGQTWIDILGILLFLFPFCFEVVRLSLPVVGNAIVSGEMSSNAGGLMRWPVFVLLPIGFLLLALQGVSELIKRVAFLMGRASDPTQRKNEKTAEEELAAFMLEQTAREASAGKKA
ncbi:MAG: TRAP transporter small permease subunit [Betaproteobacteria bacterium]|nr:TRAP transporter small permease subunit [Betaproteobacteria bacterium]MDE2122057.1 TRAP transporter small permease subunit [Betaproteobacteria bacterium]MDE2187241.1 TRAP transporter small permease subunit [Betaproteobacteria bacterium]MDE2325154.1 TRAP transporter small permease subunit [Betaproteobacteria bacterium]